MNTRFFKPSFRTLHVMGQVSLCHKNTMQYVSILLRKEILQITPFWVPARKVYKEMTMIPIDDRSPASLLHRSKLVRKMRITWLYVQMTLENWTAPQMQGSKFLPAKFTKMSLLHLNRSKHIWMAQMGWQAPCVPKIFSDHC